MKKDKQQKAQSQATNHSHSYNHSQSHNHNQNHSNIPIMVQSDSTEWNSTVHDYGTALALDLDYDDLDLDHHYEGRKNRRRNTANNYTVSLFDAGSPTSIYTTESIEDKEEELGQDEQHEEEEQAQTQPNKTTTTFPSRHNRPLPPHVPTRQAFCKLWTTFTEGFLHQAIRNIVVFFSTTAAKYPHSTILTLTVLSLSVLGTGFFTNFKLILDSDKIFTPINSPPTLHHQWLVEESGFTDIRPLMMIVHQQGDNVLGKMQLTKLFEAVDTVTNTFGYDDLCQQGTYKDMYNQPTCRVLSATRFWDHNVTLFEKEVTNDSNAIAIMSNTTYRDGQTPVFHEMVLGNAKWTNQTFQYRVNTGPQFVEHPNKLHFVQSYVTRIELPNTNVEGDDQVDLLETLILNRLKDLKREWELDDSNPLQLDFLSIYAYEIENQRALIKDMPLVMGIFLVLVVFTTLVFHKRHKVYSRSMLGMASLAAIGCSLALSYGIVWIMGIPFTNIAQILPFMVMGVGLDDTFISKLLWLL